MEQAGRIQLKLQHFRGISAAISTFSLYQYAAQCNTSPLRDCDLAYGVMLQYLIDIF